MIDLLRKNRSLLISTALWLLVLLPVAGTALLARAHAVDQRFLDDWEWTNDLVKFKEGRLHVRDLFEVYLEHRPAVPRALAVGVTVLGRGDVRAQCVLTVLFLVTAFFAISRLWLKQGGATIREAWFPLLIVSAVLFTPVQWQTFLWPVCFGTVMPCMFLALSLATAFTRWPWWVRCILGTLLAALAMLSFASGVLLWVLPLPVYLFCGGLTGIASRVKFSALWLAVMATVFCIYLEVRVQPHDSVTHEKTILSLPGGHDVTYDLRNEVPRQFAYGQQHENTMARNMPYFLEHPAEDFEFMLAFSGVLPVRGCATDTRKAATLAGGVLVTGLALLGLLCWRYRRERELFVLLLAMLCFGLYTPLAGVLVAMGRIWAGHVSTALNVRYHPHHTQIIIALVGAAFFILRHRARQRAAKGLPAGTGAGWIAGGALLGFLGAGWLYGASMMDAWRAARLRNAAAQAVSQIFPTPNWFVSYVSGNFDLTRETVAALARNKLLGSPPLVSASLTEFRRNDRVLGIDHALVKRLWKENGQWLCDGFASLPRSFRPADGILLAWRVPGGPWTIWGFSQGDAPPHYLPNAMGKDLWGIVPRDSQWPGEFMCPWDPRITVREQPPAGAQISFWAIDMDGRQVFRIGRDRKSSPDADGEILETLATPYEPPK